MVTSFQAEGMVVLDLARQIDPGAKVLTLDTGRLPEETYEVIEAVRTGLGLEVEVIAPTRPTSPPWSPATAPTCSTRTRPCAGCAATSARSPCWWRALATYEAWSTGLRRDGGRARGSIAKAERDDAHGGILKLNPLADWTREQVWAYVQPPPAGELAVRQGLHLHRLRPLHPPDPARRGRAGRPLVVEADQDRECGLHTRLGGAAASPDDRFEQARRRLRADVNARTWETTNGC